MGIIEVKDLHYSYPNSKESALKGIDLTINRGEFVLLSGPSGCGKTTFSRTLNGLIPHFYNGELTGKVTVAGMDITEHQTHELAKNVGLIFQNPDNQIFALTVEKDVAFGLENQGKSRKEMYESIEWALKTAGINHLRDRGTHELSGGQKQRLAISSILAMRPEILVLDEPTSFLDPLGAERIFKVLGDLNKEYEITVILIEHRMDLAAQYADRVVIFNDGLISHQGTPAEVFMDEKTRQLGVGIPKIVDLYRTLKNDGYHLNSPPMTPKSIAAQLVKLLPAKVEIPKKKEHDPNLDGLLGTHMQSPLIEIEDVHYAYSSEVQALNGVSLTIHKGEFIAIMGENGAGKTTLVKHLNGLLRPDSGRILIEGEDIEKQSVAGLARKVGLVFQNPDDQLFSENVEEEISFALKNFGFEEDVIAKRVDWGLNLLDIAKYKESSPFVLSGGERKRVALASVLAWDPDIVVLDEPTIGQDHGQKERLMHFLMQLRTQGKTTIIVTHDVEFVTECNPRIVLMAGGNVIADGSVKQIMTNMEAMKQASVAPPEIAKVFSILSEKGFPRDILDVSEAINMLKTVLEAPE